MKRAIIFDFNGALTNSRRTYFAIYSLAVGSNEPKELCAKVVADARPGHRFRPVAGTALGLRPKAAADLQSFDCAEPKWRPDDRPGFDQFAPLVEEMADRRSLLVA